MPFSIQMAKSFKANILWVDKVYSTVMKKRGFSAILLNGEKAIHLIYSIQYLEKKSSDKNFDIRTLASKRCIWTLKYQYWSVNKNVVFCKNKNVFDNEIVFFIFRDILNILHHSSWNHNSLLCFVFSFLLFICSRLHTTDFVVWKKYSLSKINIKIKITPRSIP